MSSSILRMKNLRDDPEGSKDLSLSDDRAERYDLDSDNIDSITVNSPRIVKKIAQIENASRNGCSELALADLADKEND